MASNARYALVVGMSAFTDPMLKPLPGAAVDADRIYQFLIDPARGNITPNNVTVLHSPTLDKVKDELADILFRTGNVENGVAILYFATHAQILGRQGTQLMVADSNLTHRTKTSLSTVDIANFIAEYRPASTIFILDVCQAGGHLAGAAELASNELWHDPTLKDHVLADGHFILGACTRDETAEENGVTGGRFTSLLLNQIETIGAIRPYEKHLTVETIAGAVVKAAAQAGYRQHPTWSGLSVSREIVLSTNPHWRQDAVPPPSVLTLNEVTDLDQQILLPYTQAQWSMSALIGHQADWAQQGIEALRQAAKSAASEDAKRTFVARTSIAVFDRFTAYGKEEDLDEVVAFAEAAVVAIARANGLYSTEIKSLGFLIAKLAQQIISSLSRWNAERGWLQNSDGPAAIGIAPIRFWDVLGRASLVALACRVASDFQSEEEIARLISEIVKDQSSLHRVSWAGQYPDMTSVLGYVMRTEKVNAQQCVQNLLERYITDVQQGYRPIEVAITPRELGIALARQFVVSPPKETFPERITADELAALCLLLLFVSEVPDLTLNSLVGRLQNLEDMGDYYLYEPQRLESQFTETIIDCTVHIWHRSSLESAASMLIAVLSCMRPVLPRKAAPMTAFLELTHAQTAIRSCHRFVLHHSI
jgi:hypothetical protein